MLRERARDKSFKLNCHQENSFRTTASLYFSVNHYGIKPSIGTKWDQRKCMHTA